MVVSVIIQVVVYKSLKLPQNPCTFFLNDRSATFMCNSAECSLQ
jgi:hypothetical protein